LSELFVGAEPRETATRAGVGRLELGLVPDDPLVDLPGVELGRLIDVLAEVVVGIVEREAQVLDEVRRGRGTAQELTRRVYRDLQENQKLELLVAAEMTLRAHLRKLVDDGVVRSGGEGDEEVFYASVS
jgi:hypothetical protein